MVLCANGSDELILLTALAYMNPGDEIIMANGTFISYYNRTQMMGAVQKRIPLVNGVHDLNAMAAAITPATTMILICNPNNPTGTTNSATEMQQFLARVPDDVLVVVDEAYVEYVTRADFPDMIGEIRAGRKNMLVLRTFAKIYGLAGLRLGYAIGDPDMLDYINRTRPVFELSAMGLQPFASETNFVAVPVGGEGSDAQVAQALAARGVAINPLGGWGLPGVIRISFGTPTENTLCINALREVMASR